MIRIGKILQDAGLVSAEDVEKAVEKQKKSGKFLGGILVEMGKLSEEELLRCLSLQMRIDYVPLKDLAIAPEALEAIPVKYVWHYKVMPVGIVNGVLKLAVSDPLNLWAIEDVQTHLKLQVEPVLSTSADIAESIKKYYGVGADTVDRLMAKEEEKKKTSSAPVQPGQPVEDIEKLAGGASVIKLVNEIIKEAVESRATDIHFEKYENELVIRYRIDGLLQPAKIRDEVKFLYSTIIARIKVMASLDIIERRIPQSGSVRVRMGSREYDLRVSVIPDTYSEGMVIRILPTEMLIDLESLGMSARERALLEELVKRPHGILYVTGPTGSGKTTTLYACLGRLNKPDVKIITVEDPVEYKMKYIEQVQVNPRAGLSFASVLRSVLRHDPDIIMVGEVRDTETAEIAVQASLTGHLVLSTLHTNDAPSAVTRLLDMGVEPYLISSTSIAMVAQRLLRQVCPHCKAEEKWTGALPEGLAAILKERKSEKIIQAKGCEKCRFTGYQGRMAIYEILPFTEEIRRLTLQKAPASQIRQAGIREGMKTLLQAGWEKVAEGLTTPQEVLRVVNLGSD